MSLFDRQSGSFRHFRAPLPEKNGASFLNSISGNNVWSIAEGENGNLWLGIIGGGLNFFDTRTTQFQAFKHAANDPLSISSDDVITVFVDKDKQLWVGTNTEGLNLLDKQTGHFTHFKQDNGNAKSISTNDIRCIFQDSKGRLWIGTESGGLNLWLGNGQFEHFTTQNGLIDRKSVV